MTRDVSRRAVLKHGALGFGALAVGAGSAQAARPARHVVGVATPAAAMAARDRAAAVHRELEFGAIGRAVAGRFPEEALAGLRRRPDVRYVEPDGRYRAIGQAVPWGIDRIDADVVHADGETGGDGDDGRGGADIAIVDTGIDDDHPDLAANVGRGVAYVACEGANCNYAWTDDHDHGTHVAGIADAADNDEGVVGVSTAATLHAVKVLDGDGYGYWSDVAAGLEWAADRGYEVANVSLGGTSASETVRDACQYAHDRGVFVVAAAGNSGPCTDCVLYPAAFETVVAVSATTEDDDLASFSSTGPEIELAAPGATIESTLVDGYGTWSGTSMASPHVAGAAAQAMDNGDAAAEARDRLAATAEDLGLGDTEQGAGLLDVDAAMTDGEDDGTDTDAAPTASWVDPSSGETVSGSVPVAIEAGDEEDDPGTLAVEYRVDGGSWRSTSYDAETGTYESTWDSTTVEDGDHALDARATDSAGNAATDTVAVTTENVDDAPVVDWLAPSDGESVSGFVVIELAAEDDRDGGADLTVEWRVDDGTWRSADYDTDTGTYVSTWDSTAVDDGDHALSARATDTAGSTSGDARLSVTVQNEVDDSAPTIERYRVTEAGSPNPHAEITADWAVADADGDLASVAIEVIDDAGRVVDAARHAVAGGDAAGTDQFKIKHARNETFDVTIAVTDARENATTASQTVRE